MVALNHFHDVPALTTFMSISPFNQTCIPRGGHAQLILFYSASLISIGNSITTLRKLHTNKLFVGLQVVRSQRKLL